MPDLIIKGNNMVCRDKLIVWTFIGLIAGFASGYLYSTRFCKVSITNRVQTELGLNQTLRELYAKNIFLKQEYVHVLQNNKSSSTPFKAKINQNIDGIITVLKQYYSANFTQKFHDLLQDETILLESLSASVQSNSQEFSKYKELYNTNIQEQAMLLTTLSQSSQSTPQNLPSFLQQYAMLTVSNIILVHEQNWKSFIENFNKIFKIAMELADFFDKNITDQFSNKF